MTITKPAYRIDSHGAIVIQAEIGIGLGSHGAKPQRPRQRWVGLGTVCRFLNPTANEYNVGCRNLYTVPSIYTVDQSRQFYMY